jgi:hypothetical protein
MRGPEYLQVSQKTLQDAEALLARGDYHQASEKFWGAAAVMVKAIAEGRGWPHGSHRDLYRVISRLVQETGRQELGNVFLLASQLHVNFYEDWLLPDQVTGAAPQIRELINSLRSLIEP